jgi:hypothetical protein
MSRAKVSKHNAGTCQGDIERDDEDGRESARPGTFGFGPGLHCW